MQGYGGATPQPNNCIYKIIVDVDALVAEFKQIVLSN